MVAEFERQNRQSAEIILADVERHGGEQSGSVQWARAVLKRLGRIADSDAGPLFRNPEEHSACSRVLGRRGRKVSHFEVGR
jgi:hypothetical protein